MNVLRRMLAFSAASCFLLTSSVVGGQWLAPEFITSDTAYAAQNFDYDEDLVMHYTSEAGTKNTDNCWDNSESFYRALPLGNGRIGAMVYGNCPTEWIDLNECTVWSAGPGSNDREGAAGYLKQVQDLIKQGKYADADSIVGSKMIGGGQAKYQKVGMLKLAMGHDKVSDYSRELDMNTAVASSSYTYQGKKYKRESFVSYPDQVMVTRITCESKGSVSMSVGYDGLLNGKTETDGSDTIVANGHGDDDLRTRGAVYYSARTKVINEGGTVSASGGKINVSGCDSVMILTSIRTNFIDSNTCNGDEKGDSAADMKKAEGKSWDELYENHLKDYQSLFKRVDIELGGDSAVTNAKTVESRISEFGKTNDPKMVETLFQYGRYLMISASRDSQAMNLQGIWNKYSSPAWGSKSTTNINYEMNYWPAFTTNLAECFTPFVEKAKALTVNGSKTAKTQYGIDEGWVLHHNTDIWNRTGPIDGSWGLWPVGGAWISNMLYDAYEFNQDEAYLADIYPVIEGSAKFLDRLMINQSFGGQEYRVISPGVSPELALPISANHYVSAGVTMDNAITRELFEDVVDASRILGKSESSYSNYEKTLSMIKPPAAGKHGQLMEWAEDWDNPRETHRHISHIYGLFPGSEYSPTTNEEISAAAAQALKNRGDAGTGWSEAWKLNCWARLKDGEHAYNLVKLLISPVNGTESGRLYANLWDAHPPFQIDGNFGFTSGIAEMLLQSTNDEITLLPALPSAWSTGHANGLCARGNFEVSEMNWANGRLTDVTIKSNSGKLCNLRYGNKTISFETEKGGEYHLSGLLSFTDKPVMLANAAKGRKVTASSGDASAAADGSDSTMWEAKGKLNGEWMTVDLGEKTDISRWAVKFGGVNGNSNYNSRDFRLQKSDDGTSWTDADIVYGNTKAVVSRNVSEFSARYVRLLLETSTQNNAGGIAVAEFEVWSEGDTAGTVSAYAQKLQAEDSDILTGGIRVEESGSGKCLGYIKSGSSLALADVDFGKGAGTFRVSASSAADGGKIEVRLGSPDGKLAGTCTIDPTGEWSAYKTFECTLENCRGTEDLYLVFTGSDGYLFNVDWFEFEGNASASKGDVNSDGSVNATDLKNLSTYMFGNRTAIDSTSSDINDDGKVNIADFCLLKEILLK
jgi:alpha-L-fucosidase 2